MEIRDGDDRRLVVVDRGAGKEKDVSLCEYLILGKGDKVRVMSVVVG